MMALEFGSEPTEQFRWHRGSTVALIASAGLIIGCFLPWKQAKGVFSDPGIATLDGSIVIFAALLACGVGLYGLWVNRAAFRGLFFLLVGIGGLCVGIMNLRLGSVWARVLDIGVSSIVGSGIYVVMVSAALMTVAGIMGYLGGSSASAETARRRGTLSQSGIWRVERSASITPSAAKTRIPQLGQSFKKHWHIYICGMTSLVIAIEVLTWVLR